MKALFGYIASSRLCHVSLTSEQAINEDNKKGRGRGIQLSVIALVWIVRPLIPSPVPQTSIGYTDERVHRPASQHQCILVKGRMPLQFSTQN